MRFKDVFTYSKGFAFSSNLFTDNENLTPVYKTTDIKNGVLLPPNNFIDENFAIFSEAARLKKGDLILSTVGSHPDVKESAVGQVASVKLSEIGSLLNQNTLILRLLSDKNSTIYFSYLANSNVFRGYLDVISRGTANQASIKVSQALEFEFLLPQCHLQNAIALYLDIKTQAIDKKINLLIQKTNYYKEYRKSIINEAVCKGLNKNVKFLETEFSFEVNADFNMFRLKDLGYLYSGLSGKSGEDFNQDNNLNNKGFIPFTNIANNTYLKKDHLGTVVVYNNENQNIVRKGDIFFLMSSEGYEDIGKSAILDDDLEDTYLNSFCKGFRVSNKKINPYFLNYLLLSDNYRKLLTIEGKGFTRINLKMEKVNDFIVFIPNSLEEQNAIVKFIDAKTQTIAKIVENINTQIITLRELRKTLINDVVTSKIKVTQD